MQVEIDRLFAPWDRPDAPGCVLTVIRDGAVVYQRGLGLANLEYGIPNTAQTVFHVGSVSKQFTAMAIAMLEGEGKLSLSDDVRVYVPELPDFGRRITLDHLVHHTSGLRDYCELLPFAGFRVEDVYTSVDILELVFRQRELNFPPGEKHLYCNTGYALLALIVERASGQNLRAFCDEHIFRPLGMDHTVFQDSHQMIVPNRAYSYFPAEEGTYRIELSSHGTPGAGCLLTTAEDLIRWDRNFHTHTVGGAALIKRLHEKGRLNDGREVDYAFGLVVGEYRGLPAVYHYGSDAGYLASLVRFPEQRCTVILMGNLGTIDLEGLTMRVADLCLAGHFPEGRPAEALEEARPVQLPPGELEHMAGVYYCPEEAIGWRLDLWEGKLILGIDHGLEMETLAGGVLRSVKRPWFRARFETGEDGRLYLHEGGHVYEPRERASPTVGELAEYVGHYYSPELEVLNEVTLQGDQLLLRQPKLGCRPLIPTFQDAFYYDLSGVVELLFTVDLSFDRDERGRVSGFSITTGCVKRLRFYRMEGALPQESAEKPSNHRGYRER